MSNLPIGSNKCRCGVCGEYFINIAAFDTHRKLLSSSPEYRRSCMTPQTSNWPLERDSMGYWRLPKRQYVGEVT